MTLYVILFKLPLTHPQKCTVLISAWAEEEGGESLDTVLVSAQGEGESACMQHPYKVSSTLCLITCKHKYL